MSSQLFKKQVPLDILDDFLKSNCAREGKFYVFSKITYRKAIYHNKIIPFCDNLINYYYSSKQYYVKRDLNYSKFTTVLRQLCNLHKLPYTSRIIYNKSTYDILYYISSNPE